MAEVVNMALLGRRNVGKSSLANLMTGQEMSIVSSVAGTTTDPVRKRFEFPGIGAVNVIDSAGIDDEGDLGRMRAARTKELVTRIDVAVLLYSGNEFSRYEKDLAKALKNADVPFVVLHNQSDMIPMDRSLADSISAKYSVPVMEFSCDIMDDRERAAALDGFFAAVASVYRPFASRTIMEGLVKKNGLVWLVCPVDSEAPEGRLILPQVMAIRDILDRGGRAEVMQPEQLEVLVSSGVYERPDIVVVDSQVFGKVEKIVPGDIPLTGFSILLARSKGPFEQYVDGVRKIDSLKDGDKVLILESCSHHSSCDDIGRVKIPALLRKKTGADLDFTVVPSLEKIGSFSPYAMVIQCGACMITRRQLVSRLRPAIDAGIPIANYGMVLAYMNGILDRSLEVFSDIG